MQEQKVRRLHMETKLCERCRPASVISRGLCVAFVEIVDGWAVRFVII